MILVGPSNSKYSDIRKLELRSFLGLKLEYTRAAAVQQVVRWGCWACSFLGNNDWKTALVWPGEEKGRSELVGILPGK